MSRKATSQPRFEPSIACNLLKRGPVERKADSKSCASEPVGVGVSCEWDGAIWSYTQTNVLRVCVTSNDHRVGHVDQSRAIFEISKRGLVQQHVLRIQDTKPRYHLIRLSVGSDHQRFDAQYKLSIDARQQSEASASIYWIAFEAEY